MGNNINQHLATIILVGRPNVGKSTLFNRLLQRRQAIEDELEHTTRDVIREELNLDANQTLILADSAGDDPSTGSGSDINQKANAQRERFINEASGIIFVYDAIDGFTGEDKRVLQRVRRQNVPFIIVANKADNKTIATAAVAEFTTEASRLVTVSAIHNLGVEDVYDWLEQFGQPKQLKHLDKIVVLGKPNAGKSTLFNALIKDSISIVSTDAGTTRDIVGYETTLGDRLVKFLDTAGLARRSKAMRGLQRYATLRIQEVLDVTDCVLLCIDAKAGLSVQDARLAGLCLEKAVSVVIVITKWDLVASEERAEKLLDELRRDLRFLWWAPVVFVSAQIELNLNELRQEIAHCLSARTTKIEQPLLDQTIERLKQEHSSFTDIKSIEQQKTNPPTILVDARHPLHRTRLRQLGNELRRLTKMGPTPLVMRTTDRVRAQRRGLYRAEII
ncbi:MAG: ribosome biogenesis GTPase Der [bacterium]|nr:ribosome biogenesis GTPase Der [bacterium]